MNSLITDNKINALRWCRSVLTNLNWKRTHVIQIKQYRKKRSLAQNRTYWMILQCIADQIGDNKEDIHEAYKRKYLPWRSGFHYYFYCLVPGGFTRCWME